MPDPRVPASEPTVSLSPHGRDEAVKRWTTRQILDAPLLTADRWVPAAAFDAVVAERDEAVRQREQAATSRNVIAQERDLAIDRLDAVSRERDAAIAAGQPLAEIVDYLLRCFPDDAKAEAALAAWRSVSGSSEPPKESA